MAQFKKIGVLTSGGDAPGMNAAIRAVTRYAIHKNIEVVGIYNGFKGLLENQFRPMKERDVSLVINHGGTMLYTSRCDEFKTDAGLRKAVEVCHENGIDGIVTIGGDGTFRGANDLCRYGIPCIGIPATIDNDIACTDATVGFDTAMNTVLSMVDRLRDTGESHARCNVVEVMGRNAGDIAVNTAIALGATAVAIREYPFDEEYLYEKMIAGKQNGKRCFIVIVSEGTGRLFSESLAEQVQTKTGISTNYAKLGHIQRGGSPTLVDRVLATRLGCEAVELLTNGIADKVVCLEGNDITSIDIKLSQIMDKMHNNKIKPGDLDNLSEEVINIMRAKVERRVERKKNLYEMVDIISI
ncbi:MAG: ATP-dependent 6-phosphofructokinase [Eubacteriales bacterium]|nr:ATP-dependent 6-phosphofructokinase [Eubacteriales bacterium]MDD4474486.1 ATP-dependent 6-phosphofructokinase [Eubacteriales bacterium]